MPKFAEILITKNANFDIMKEKILALLTAKGGQYNLPKDVLSSVADLAPKDLAEDKIEEWVTTIAMPQMALLQRYSDSRVTTLTKELEDLKKKSKEETKKDEHDLEKLLGGLEERISKTVDEKLSGYSELKNQHEELLKRQKEVEDAQKLASFQELKKRVAKEVGLNDRMLNLVDGKVTIDMDETKVKEVFADCKKEFIGMGLMEVENTLAGDDTAVRQRAKSRLDEFIKEHPDSQM